MSHTSTGNRLLDVLPPEASKLLTDAGRFMDLPLAMPLSRSGETPPFVYFLTSGITSYTFTSEKGNTIELATLGKEGVIGGLSVLSHDPMCGDAEMQMAGAGYRVPLTAFEEAFRENVQVRERMLEFAHHQLAMAYQILACNRLHKAQARFARWLLLVQDRSEQDVLALTQEFMADMLGTRRTTVNEVAGELQRRGAIEYRRGAIRISDRKALEGETCECYPLLRERFDRLYKPEGSGPKAAGKRC